MKGDKTYSLWDGGSGLPPETCPSSAQESCLQIGNIDQVLTRLKRSSFRRRFHLGAVEKRIWREKGPEVVTRHAREIILSRLAPAQPYHDGRQTPWRGHPVFVAQHATATCCRRCLARWHGITVGKKLTAGEVDYVVAVIMAWLTLEATAEKRSLRGPCDGPAGGIRGRSEGMRERRGAPGKTGNASAKNTGTVDAGDVVQAGLFDLSP